MKRTIQGVFVCRHDQARTSSYITKSGIVLFDNPLQSVIAETKLTEKFIEDEKATDLSIAKNVGRGTSGS